MLRYSKSTCASLCISHTVYVNTPNTNILGFAGTTDGIENMVKV